MSRSDIVDVTLTRVASTQWPDGSLKGILVRDANGKECWLPGSQVEVEDKGRGIVEVSLPEWLAIEKGLV